VLHIDTEAVERCGASTVGERRHQQERKKEQARALRHLETPVRNDDRFSSAQRAWRKRRPNSPRTANSKDVRPSPWRRSTARMRESGIRPEPCCSDNRQARTTAGGTPLKYHA